MQVGLNVITHHEFGPLKFRTRGQGIYFVGEKTRAKLSAMTLQELQAVNKAAWAKRKSMERFLRGKENVTLHGWNDQANLNLNVAEAICKASWRAIMIIGAPQSAENAAGA